MSFILNLQSIEAGRDDTGNGAARQPSTWSLSLCFSNQSWAAC